MSRQNAGLQVPERLLIPANNLTWSLQSDLRFQNFKRLPIPDSRDAAIGHSLGQCDAALVSNVAKAATNHGVAKTKHQGPAIVLDAVAEGIIFDAKFDEPIVISSQKVQFDLAP